MKIKRRATRADVPSMAMGDIAFNLLIFFVILARAQDDSHLQWTPAEASNLESAGHSIISVLIDSDEKLYLNGQPIGESNLEMKIEELLGNSPPGDRTVLLKVHRDATALRFEPVIESISNAGGELVHIVEEDRDG
ncbi:MAG: biopolymer transporter ExbD [Planctomycetota bacterium]|jgi:biopolymer transport protein ExbD|nr:biopolymer transporter ExbD [Planctomycetota bacterium]MEC9008885.1 biopolymer transporter ExbD [Planctomycetota bacterium]MED5398897.1 biopolymer transporter ExbD [Planctomycetota bacterium]MED5447358.1 biopolymer transporter ExbD [Planctomycetota bacterium]MEE3284109.1 biopolymer transporter ExbD [Planctomycetota bacterium]